MDMPPVIDAFRQMIGDLKSTAWRIRLTGLLAVAIRCSPRKVSDGATPSAQSSEWQKFDKLPEDDAVLYGVMVRMILGNLYQGFPLSLAMAALEAHVADAPLFDCQECGYGLARSFHSCPLCGVRMLGVYGLRRARVGYN
jgi:hypothetical protein